ncbi:unnamed protein product [Closterium sp. Naga37s-1]|nr:unnamed protein product [Closterium sp. Naga37s-1]
MTLAAPPSTPFPSPASPSSASPSLAAAAGTPVLTAAPLLPPQPAPAKPSSSSLLTSFSPSTTSCFPAPSISPIFPLPFPMSCFPGPTISSASASPRFVSSTRFAHFTSSCISPITLASLFRTAVCLLGCRVDGAFHAFHRHQPTLPSRRDAAAAVTAAAATSTARGGQLVTRGTAQGAGYLVRAGQHGFRQRSSRDDEAEGAFARVMGLMGQEVKRVASVKKKRREGRQAEADDVVGEEDVAKSEGRAGEMEGAGKEDLVATASEGGDDEDSGLTGAGSGGSSAVAASTGVPAAAASEEEAVNGKQQVACRWQQDQVRQSPQ